MSTSKSMLPPNQSRPLRRESSDSSQHHHQSQQQQQRQRTPANPSVQRSPASPQLRRTQSQKREVTHALPPKPVVIPAPFRAPTHSSIMEASTMADPMVRSPDKDKRHVNGSSSKPISSSDDPLPPDWEMRRPRNQETNNEIYYFNIRTEVSQWTRPTDSGKAVSPSRSRDKDRVAPSASYSYGKEGEHRPATATQLERQPETRSSRRPEPSRPSPPQEVEVTSFGDRRYHSVDRAQPPPRRRTPDIRRDDRSPPHTHNHNSARSFFPEANHGSPKRTRPERDPLPSQILPSRQEVIVDRPMRSRRGSSPSAGDTNANWRDSSRAAPHVPPQAALSERPWNDRRESLGQPAPALSEIQKPRQFGNESRGEPPPRVGRGYGDRIHDIEGVAPSSTIRSTLSASPISSIHSWHPRSSRGESRIILMS